MKKLFNVLGIFLVFLLTSSCEKMKPVPPSLSATTATEIRTTAASLNGTVNPNSLSTTVSFEYGLTTNYGTTSTVSQSPLNGNLNINVTSNLTGLNPGKLYHFRMKAENSLGVYYSDDMTFSTLGQTPKVITQAATNLQVKTATINGSVNPNYLSSTITFEWGTTTNYGNSITPSQSTLTGDTFVYVSADLSGLSEGTTYHFKINASNELGTNYGEDGVFTTLSRPTLTTSAVLDSTFSSAISGGNITFDGGATITARGVCWSLSENPTIANSKTTDGTGIGKFSSMMSLLESNTTYYVRAYATNSVGTAYGTEITFTIWINHPEPNVNDIDGNIYSSVKIGNQIWITENLETTKYRDGTTIPLVEDNSKWGALSTPGYCWYKNDVIMKATYGALYNFYTVNTGNLCPMGWHVPTSAEFNTLITFLGGKNVARGKLKEMGTIHWYRTNIETTNESGFSGLPGGVRFGSSGEFWNQRFDGYWWSSTGDYFQSAYILIINDEDSNVDIYRWIGSNGFSVRCLKD